MHAQIKPDSFHKLQFDNRFVAELPADPVADNYVRQVEGACFSRVRPKTFSAPQTVAWSPEVADLLDLEHADCASEPFAEIFSGSRLLPQMDPYAMCYGGHQFGVWAGQLGDGRAINLGEVVNRKGERWALQLKGAGPTPYARSADGLAVMRSSVREFLCSEAMHHLGVPTTRALSLVATGDPVWRDMFYDGHPRQEPGAVVCRVAPSFIRFGNFQIYASRGETDVLRRLVDYTIRFDFPHLPAPGPETYVAWFEEVCRRTADMIVHWMRVGFVHGVMNTDNMSILGLTIDYGPYGWLEDYDPNWTPNTTDAEGRRYCYGAQPQIAQWNLYQLANAIFPLVNDAEPLHAALERYAQAFQAGWQRMMAAKLGWQSFDAKRDMPMIHELLAVLRLAEIDMTLFYRLLAHIRVAEDPIAETLMAHFRPAFYRADQLTADRRERLLAWMRTYGERVQTEGTRDETRAVAMNAVNPKYVLRNYLAQVAIDQAEAGDFSGVNELLEVMRHPYAEQPGREHYAERRPEWARHKAGCSMLSCSS